MPDHSTKACWFGEGHHKSRAPQSSTPRVPSLGLYLSAGEGLCWPSGQGFAPLYPVLRLDPQWGRGTC